MKEKKNNIQLRIKKQNQKLDFTSVVGNKIHVKLVLINIKYRLQTNLPLIEIRNTNVLNYLMV